MLIAISNYTRPLEEVDSHRQDHIAYVKNLISANKLLAAGRQTPATGAVIIANHTVSHAELLELLAEDPYCKVGVAEYKIIEFNPVLCDEAFRAFVCAS